MTGELRRKIGKRQELRGGAAGERLAPRTKRSGAFAVITALGNGQTARIIAVERETEGTANAARIEKETGKAEGTDS